MKKKVQYRTIVTTDDEEIAEWASETPMKVVERPPELAEDDTPIKPVLNHAIERQRLYPDDDVVLLYPTYPGRSYDDITDVLHWYQQQEARTCLCCQPPTLDTPTHLAVKVDDESNQGTFPYEGDPIPYRRQDAEGTITDYLDQPSDGSVPPIPYNVRELSHFMCVFRISELEYLSNNLFNENTLYYELGERVIDVDYEEDWEEYLEQK